MDVSFLAPFGINLPAPVVVMTIGVAWWSLYALDENDGVINHPALRIAISFFVSIALFLILKYSTGTISGADIWSGFINAAIGVGAFYASRNK